MIDPAPSESAAKRPPKSPGTKLLFSVGLGLLLPLMATSCKSCSREDPLPPPPAPSPTPVASTPPLELPPQDAGTDVHDAGTDAKKPGPTAGGKPAGNLKKCCQAIKQNAANAPLPTKAMLENLAASCFALASSGGTSFPQGAGYSPACK